jgi:hypothetical protein
MKTKPAVPVFDDPSLDPAEVAAVARLSESEVLARAAGFGPAIIGEALHRRAKEIRERSDNGRLGPAITDPDYAAKQEAKRTAGAVEVDSDDADGEKEEGSGDLKDPWQWTTLSGAKQLAQTKGVSYAPRIKRVDLIELLKAAGVEPPAPPDDDDDDDDED